MAGPPTVQNGEQLPEDDVRAELVGDAFTARPAETISQIRILMQPGNRVGETLRVFFVDQKAVYFMADQMRRRPRREGDDRAAMGPGFDDGSAEGFGAAMRIGTMPGPLGPCPRKSATNGVAGLARNSAGVAICSILPWFITATRSASSSASS